MQGEEFVLSIIAMAMGTGILIVGIAKLTDLIKTWINRNNNPVQDEAFDRLAKAFMHHKRVIEKRMQNVEAVIADGSQNKESIQIEQSESENTLLNDLKDKNKVRS